MSTDSFYRFAQQMENSEIEISTLQSSSETSAVRLSSKTPSSAIFDRSVITSPPTPEFSPLGDKDSSFVGNPLQGISDEIISPSPIEEDTHTVELKDY